MIRTCELVGPFARHVHPQLGSCRRLPPAPEFYRFVVRLIAPGNGRQTMQRHRKDHG